LCVAGACAGGAGAGAGAGAGGGGARPGAGSRPVRIFTRPFARPSTGPELSMPSRLLEVCLKFMRSETIVNSCGITMRSTNCLGLAIKFTYMLVSIRSLACPFPSLLPQSPF
jgi:hypothetical protein